MVIDQRPIQQRIFPFKATTYPYDEPLFCLLLFLRLLSVYLSVSLCCSPLASFLPRRAELAVRPAPPSLHHPNTLLSCHAH